MAKSILTAAYLKEFIDYSPETGRFVWIEDGSLAGKINKEGCVI